MRVNMVGAFIRNAPFGTEIAFAKGMEQRDHTVTRIDPDYSDQVWDTEADATLVFKWLETDLDKLGACRGPKILYQPDDIRFPHIKEMVMRMRPHVDHLLTFDQYGVQFGQQLGFLTSGLMHLTADDELYKPNLTVERDIDVSFVGSLTRGPNHASRMRMCEIVQDEAARRGWRTWFGESYFDGYPTPVDIYQRSKVVLNHATDVGQPFGFGFGLQCRHFEVAMTATALLSNSRPYSLPTAVAENWFDANMTFDSEGSLIEQLTSLLVEEYAGVSKWRLYGHALHSCVMEHHAPWHRADQLVDLIRRIS